MKSIETLIDEVHETRLKEAINLFLDSLMAAQHDWTRDLAKQIFSDKLTQEADLYAQALKYMRERQERTCSSR